MGFALQRRLQSASITVSSLHPGVVCVYLDIENTKAGLEMRYFHTILVTPSRKVARTQANM